MPVTIGSLFGDWEEFTVRWSGGPLKEVVRQQWSFSPVGSTIESEDYVVDLNDENAVEQGIPDGGNARRLFRSNSHPELAQIGWVLRL
jgi:hypothetical protein